MDPRIDHSPHWYRTSTVIALFGAAVLANVVTMVLTLGGHGGSSSGVAVTMALYAAVIAYLAVAEAATMWRRRQHLRRPAGTRSDPTHPG
jgi:lipopolysaccharide export LptBFGC system permease protein LptF